MTKDQQSRSHRLSCLISFIIVPSKVSLIVNSAMNKVIISSSLWPELKQSLTLNWKTWEEISKTLFVLLKISFWNWHRPEHVRQISYPFHNTVEFFFSAFADLYVLWANYKRYTNLAKALNNNTLQKILFLFIFDK